MKKLLLTLLLLSGLAFAQGGQFSGGGSTSLASLVAGASSTSGSLTLQAGAAFGTADTGTPTLTGGTNLWTVNQPMRFPTGASNAPSVQVGAVGSGFYYNGSNAFYMMANGNQAFFVYGGTCCAMYGPSTANFGWSSGSDPGTGIDTGLNRYSAGVIGAGLGGGAANYSIAAAGHQTIGAKGVTAISSYSPCETSGGTTTLSGASTNTGLNCLPANSIILGVVYRITTTITTAASFTIGDAGSATRYCAAQSTLTAGTTGFCTAAGYFFNSAAAPIKITPNTTPGAGAIELQVITLSLTAPTS